MIYGLLSIYKILIGGIYFLLKLLPTQQKAVLISRKNRESSIDFRLISKEIANSHPDTKIVILNHRMKNKISHAIEVLREMYHLATSKACVVDSYIIPVSNLKHKKDLIVVQIWHALGAIKDFGHLAIGKKEGSSRRMAEIMNMHKGYTHIIAGSEAMVDIFSRAFNTDSKKILPYALPRIDYLLDDKQRQKNKAKILNRYPEIKNKKVILYAPTFRKKGKISPKNLMKAINHEKYSLIIKQHINDDTNIEPTKGSIIDDEFDLLELMSVADYMITDYSAAAFEAATLDIPIYFWAFDIDKYKNRRGLALNYEKEMPGLVSKSAEEIIKSIEGGTYDMKRLYNFKNKYVGVLDGTSARKIVGLLKL